MKFKDIDWMDIVMGAVFLGFAVLIAGIAAVVWKSVLFGA